MTTKKIVFVAIDVDDTSFHGAGIIQDTGELSEFKCKPDGGVLKKKLIALFGNQYEIRLCYEASYIGYSLCRFLRNNDIHGDIIAPSLIPVKAGARVKTDRLDAAKLAGYYAKDMLTPIYIPDEEDEEVRDIIRSRNFMIHQRKRLKTHILSACTRYGINFREETGRKTNRTDLHIAWLKKRLKLLGRPVCQHDIEMLLYQFTRLLESIQKIAAPVHHISQNA